LQNTLKIFITIIHVLYIIFIHDTSMYIHITCINAHIHQGLNTRLQGDAPRSSPPNHFKSLLNFFKKFNFITFDIKLFKNFKLQHAFSFSKFIQMLQMKTWSWNLFNNLFMKLNIIYDYAIWRIQKKTLNNMLWIKKIYKSFLCRFIYNIH